MLGDDVLLRPHGRGAADRRLRDRGVVGGGDGLGGGLVVGEPGAGSAREGGARADDDRQQGDERHGALARGGDRGGRDGGSGSADLRLVDLEGGHGGAFLR